MLLEEAQWIGEQLTTVCKPGMRLLNVGSGTLHSRTVLQQHMHQFIFKPLQDLGVVVVHTDIQNAEGVDLVGNLTNPTFIEKLKSLQFDCILCSNLLEHIVERDVVINTLQEITPINGYALITVPYVYPYHLDPIDTMYRPSVQELTVNFSKLKVVTALNLTAQRLIQDTKKQKNYFEMLAASPQLALRLLVRSLLPFYKFNTWKQTVKDLVQMFKPFQVTCVVFQKL